MKFPLFISLFFVIACSYANTVLADISRLEPVRTDSPRSTLESFLNAMNDYKRGTDTGQDTLTYRLRDAVFTLDLSLFPLLLRDEKGREAAIFIKEVLDRIVVIDLNTVPQDETITRWRIPKTPLTILKIEDGERAGEYLFSSQSVVSAREYFERVKDLPYLKESGQGANYKQPWLEWASPEWAREISFGLYRWQWLGLFLAFIFGLIGKFIAQRLTDYTRNIVERTKGEWGDHLLQAIEKPSGLICASLIWFLAIRMLRIEGEFLNFLTSAVQIIFSLACVWLAYRLAGVATDLVRHFSSNKLFLLNSHLEPLFLTTLKMFILVFGVLLSMQNLGINVMSVLAGLGLGGLAFALAAKDTAANVFGSIMILWDKPFAVGDWIVAGNVEGTVEEIGFRSTRIRTFYRSQVTIPNSHLASINIDNMGRRTARRIRTFLYVPHHVPAENLEAFLEGIKNIVKANKYTDKQNIHVCFNDFSDYAVKIMLYCFLVTPDWATELVERQNIFLEIKRLAESLHIRFAYPTQSLHLESTPEKSLPLLNPYEGEKIRELREVSAAFGPDGHKARPEGSGFFSPNFRDLKK